MVGLFEYLCEPLLKRAPGALNHYFPGVKEAVPEGADTLDKVQQKTKVGTSDPSCIPEVEQLIRFYKEKYFGV